MVGFLFLAFSSPVLHCKARRKDASTEQPKKSLFL
jgi:hypothetical protein